MNTHVKPPTAAKVAPTARKAAAATEPLKLAKVNFLIRKSASLGMAATLQVMGTVSSNILGRMDTPQLVSWCASIRRFML